MDKYSFLNAANTAFFADLYDQYLINPDSVEPSWRAFFQGFDFGMESVDSKDFESVNGSELITVGVPGSDRKIEVPQELYKEFQVVRLIDCYRSRGNLFSKTNPVMYRRIYFPSLVLETLSLDKSDLDTVINAGEIHGNGPSILKKIIEH